MSTFEYTFTVKASLAAVNEFHRDTRALKRLTPPPAFVQLHQVEPLAEKSVSTFTLWMGPIPLRWRAEHTRVDEHGFTDIQTAGPLQKWEHTHTFTPLDDKTTKIHESIEYAHHPGFHGLMTRILFCKPALTMMFMHRERVTKKHLRDAQ